MSKTVQTSLALLSLLLSHSVLSEPLFFKAIKGDKELMILGSIHMGRPEMYPLPDQVMDFLGRSDALITEMKLSDQAPAFDMPVQSTREVLDPKQKSKLENINSELGYAPAAFLGSPAWQTALTLQVSQFAQMGFSQELGIDTYITERANEQQIPILGLETMEFQLGLFTKDPHISKLLLVDTIDNWEENRKIAQCLADSWEAGDSEQLTMVAEQGEIDEEINEQFISQRNKAWADKLDSAQFIGKGRYLVVVGALHLVGEGNLPSLLEDRNFTLTQLSRPTKGKPCQLD